MISGRNTLILVAESMHSSIVSSVLIGKVIRPEEIQCSTDWRVASVCGSSGQGALHAGRSLRVECYGNNSMVLVAARHARKRILSEYLW